MLTSSRLLRGVPAHPNASPAMTAGAQLMAMVAESRCGRAPDDDEIDRLRDEVEAAAVPWLDRMARAAVAVAEPVLGPALDAIADACQREGDRWGEALVALMHGTSCLWRGETGTASLERAARVFADSGRGGVRNDGPRLSRPLGAPGRRPATGGADGPALADRGRHARGARGAPGWPPWRWPGCSTTTPS